MHAGGIRIIAAAATCFAVTLAGAVLVALAQTPGAQAQEKAAQPPISFNRDILPILSNNCFACHGPDEKKRETSFTSTRRKARSPSAGVIEPGNAAESLLIEMITHPDPNERMPPRGFGTRADAKADRLLRRWIDEGAKWDTHWAYTAPVRAGTAGRSASGLGAQPDRSVHPRAPRTRRPEAVARSRQGDAAPARDLDLTGLPPTPAEVDAFSPTARPTPTRSASTRCCSRRTTASAWPCRGSTPPATPTPTATTSTACARCGRGATG